VGLLSRSRGPRDRVEPGAVADFGRVWLLKEESGLDPMTALEALDPIRKPIYHEPDGTRLAAEELRRHAARGEWEAIGAWQFADDFVDDEELKRELTDLALLTLAKMQITNLAIHIPYGALPRYEELTGGRPPHDGFFGPPAFDSHFGPSRAERES
jgi:hypothetical protein